MNRVDGHAAPVIVKKETLELWFSLIEREMAVKLDVQYLIVYRPLQMLDKEKKLKLDVQCLIVFQHLQMLDKVQKLDKLIF